MIVVRSVLGLAVAAGAAAAGAYQEPAYDVVDEQDAFEIRRYAPHVVAQTTAHGDFQDARTEAFSRLFAYITGGNEERREMSMTVPVTSTAVPLANAGGRSGLAMPVSTDAGGSAAQARLTMRFALPAQISLDAAPKPSDPRVTVRQVRHKLFAVQRYSGHSNQANYEVHRNELLDHLAGSGYEPVGPAMLAVYNGPHTPWFLRRNEVMVPVRATDTAAQPAQADAS